MTFEASALTPFLFFHIPDQGPSGKGEISEYSGENVK
jgi:hypothetical protein